MGSEALGVYRLRLGHLVAGFRVATRRRFPDCAWLAALWPLSHGTIGAQPAG